MVLAVEDECYTHERDTRVSASVFFNFFYYY